LATGRGTDTPLELQVADRVLTLEQSRDRELGIQIDQHAVEVPLPVARQEQGGLAQVFDGRVPVWTAAPLGSCSRSTIATRLPK
jgi:hypothetical protein